MSPPAGEAAEQATCLLEYPVPAATEPQAIMHDGFADQVVLFPHICHVLRKQFHIITVSGEQQKTSPFFIEPASLRDMPRNGKHDQDKSNQGAAFVNVHTMCQTN